MAMDEIKMEFSDDDSSSSRHEVHMPKAKGRPIPGIDYGLNLVTEASEKSSNGGGERAPGSPVPPQQRQMQQPPQQRQMQQPPQQRQMQQPPQQRQMQQPPQQRPFEMSMSQAASESGSQGQVASGLDSDSQSGSNSVYGGDDGSGSGGLMSDDFVQQYTNTGAPSEEQLSYDEVRRRKIEGLARLERLAEAGYEAAGKKCTLTTSLEEIEEKVSKLQTQRDLDNSIKMQRKLLVGFSTIIESVCANDDWNIFDLDLQGWSESVYENITEYDEVFEELYYKYKETVSMPPELKLLGMVAGSAWMFHMSRSMFKKAASKVPEFNDVMRSDPELRRRYQDVASKVARERGMPDAPGPAPAARGSIGGAGGGSIGGAAGSMQGLLSGLFGAPGKVQGPARPPMPSGPRPEGGRQPGAVNIPKMSQVLPGRQSRTRVPMADPDDVDGLLSSLQTGGSNSGAASVDEIDLSEIESYSDIAG
jgi:hypothetical protein